MSLYLVDFENVHDSGLTGVSNLTENDDICIFYSVKSEHMSFDTHVNIMKSAAKVRYIKLRRSAKNYLDFQLVTHLGFLIGSGHPGPYYIISKDTGYDSALDYWKDHGVTVLRQPSINFNLTQRKATGQAPAHNTPPAIVLFKEGSTISTRQIPIIRNGSGSTEEVSDDTNGAAAEPIMEMPVIDDVAAAIEQESGEPDTAEASAARSQEKKEKSSRSKKNNSRKKTSRDSFAESNGTNSSDEKSGIAGELTDAADLSEQFEKSGSAAADTKPETQDPGMNSVDGLSADELVSDTGAPGTQVKISPQTLPESYRKRVRTALRGKNIPSANYSSIYKAIINSYDKLALNNLLVKTFGSSKGGEVYNLIRDIFTDYQSMLG